MDKLERAQIRLLLDNLSAERRDQADIRNRAMHAEHSAKRVLRSGATVKAAIRIAEELATAYVRNAVAAVADVAKDTEAFNMIVVDANIMFQDLQPTIDQAVKLATAGSDRMLSVDQEARRLFGELQTKVLKLLEVHRFTFLKTSPGDRKELFPRFAAPVPMPTNRNKGGKPLAEHWDDMWSSIAVQLWQGDLQPKTQADISNAMMDWFSISGIEIGETAVRTRARKLWLKYEAAKLGS